MTEDRQSETSTDATLHAGQIVAGTYCIERLIGKGGMAEVWEATNQRTGKRVALKAIRRGLEAETGGPEALRREAVAASRVNHPNVVNIYDVVDHEGSTCIVMEMLDGEPLDAYLGRKGFLGLDAAATVILPAMRGVAAANTLGVVHRDLKPKNIFLCVDADGRMLTTKVLDFGISVLSEKLAGAPLPAQMVPTHGTPAYMSPEHIQGLADLDGRADVYGFGVLFFEALTGQLPFLGAPGPDLLMRIVKEPPPRVTLFRPDLPAAIAEILDRAMAKDPKDRFPSLEAFIAAVEECVLPPSELPRALTPMAGVPLFSLPESRSGPTAPPPADVAPAEGSGEESHTRLLFTLPREEGAERTTARKIVIIRPDVPAEPEPAGPAAAAEAAVAPEPASPGDAAEGAVEPEPAGPVGLGDGRFDWVWSGQDDLESRRHKWGRYGIAVLLSGGMLLFVAWLAFPRLPAALAPGEPPVGRPAVALDAALAPASPAARVVASGAVGVDGGGADALGQRRVQPGGESAEPTP